jgi:hypothetical protein
VFVKGGYTSTMTGPEGQDFILALWAKDGVSGLHPSGRACPRSTYPPKSENAHSAIASPRLSAFTTFPRLGSSSYLRFSLSRNCSGNEVSMLTHTTIWRWVQRYAPGTEQKRCRCELKPTDGSWRVDETYIGQGGKWPYPCH